MQVAGGQELCFVHCLIFRARTVPDIPWITKQETETVTHHQCTDFENMTDNTLALKRLIIIQIYRYFKSQNNLQYTVLSPIAPTLITISPRFLIPRKNVTLAYNKSQHFQICIST